MLLDTSHPLLQDCVFLGMPMGKARRNLRWRGGPGVGTVTGTPEVTLRLGAHQAIKLGSALSDPYEDFSPFSQIYPPSAKGLTVIARVRAASAHVGTIVDSTTADSGTSAGGFKLGFKNTGNTGFNFTVYASGGSITTDGDAVGSASAVDLDVVVAGVYLPHDRVVQIYRQGRMTKEVASAGTDWNPLVATAPLRIGRNCTGSAEAFQGTAGWVAVFDRPLTGGEIMEWSLDHQWEFLGDDFGALLGEGDLVFTTGVDIGPEYEPEPTPTFETGVLIGQRARGRIDGRSDLLDVARYRR
jgi:hypothetical protein